MKRLKSPWHEFAKNSRAQRRLASSTLRDLVIGSGLEFEDRGAHRLKGVPRMASFRRRLYVNP